MDEPNQKPVKNQPEDKPRRGVGTRIGLSVAVVIGGAVAILLGQILGLWLAGYVVPLFGGLPEAKTTITTYTIIKILPLFFLAVIIYLFRADLKELGLGKVKNWTYLLLLPLIYIATAIISALVSIIVAFLLPEYNAAQPQNLGLGTVGPNDLLVTGLFLVVLVPLVEEFVFRGYLFGLLRRYLSFWWVTVIVSILFAVAHGQLNVALNVFILSLALCYIREKTGSIWTGVGLHALKNFVAFLLLFVYNVA